MKPDFTKYTDEELISMMKGKKPASDEAFSEIYKRYSVQVNKYCTCMLRDKEEALDIFQETFLRFYHNYSSFNSGNLPSFIIKIARNLCLNRIRDRKITVPLESQQLIELNYSSYEKDELFSLILNAIEVLDEIYKEAFILRELDGLSFQEVAGICDISVDNAKKRVLRAKEKIIQILAPYVKDLCK